MAGENDLMIEVTGSANKAVSALDKVISKLSALRDTFDKLTPSLNEFTSKMDSIASSSKAVSAIKNFTDSTSKSALTAKDAESKMAMYQARLDRATLSMDKSRVASEKLASAQKKLKESAGIDAANTAFLNNFQYKGFSNEASKFNNTAAPDLGTPDIPTPPIGSARLASEMNVPSATIPMKFNTAPAISSVDQMRAYIDKISPSVSRMSSATQSDFEKLSAELFRISSQIDNQRALYRQLASATEQAENATGEGSAKYLQLEKRMLSADGAIDKLIAKQVKLKTQISEVSSSTAKTSFGFSLFGDSAEKSASKATTGFQKTMNMMEKMFIRILAFRIFSAVQQAITDGFNDMAQGSSQANAVLSQLSTSSLYLKNSIAASLMPAIQAMTPVIVELIDHLADLFNMIAMLTARIFNNASTVTIAKKASVDYAASIAKTGDAAKEAQKSILGFDELNNLSKPQSSSSNGMPDFKDMFETVKIPDWVNGIGDFTDPIKNTISNWWNGLTDPQKWGAGIGGTAGAVIGGIIGHLICPGIGTVLGALLGGTAGAVIGAWWEGLTTKEKWSAGIGAGAGAVIGGIIGGMIGGPIGVAVGATLGGVIGGLIGKWWEDLTKPEKWSAGLGASAGAIIGTMIGGIIGGPIGALVGAALGGTIGGIVGKWWEDLTTQKKWEVGKGAGAGATIGGIIGTLICPGLGTILGIMLGGTIGATLGSQWDNISKWFNQKSVESQSWFGGQWGNILDIFQPDMITSKFQDAYTGAKGTWSGIGKWASDTWSSIISEFKPDLISNKFQDAYMGAKGKWSDASTWAKNTWESIVSQFKPNLISSAFQKAWDALENLKLKLPHITWESGGAEATGWIANTLKALSLPTSMPKLAVDWYAKGGVFDTPQIIGVGEGADSEAVLPLNDKVYSQIAQGIADRGNSSSGMDIDRIVDSIAQLKSAIRDIQVVLYASDREIAQSANRGNGRIDKNYNPIATT